LVTARPRLLFVAPWFLFPSNTGGRIRTRDILRGLKGGRFEITLVSPAPLDGKGYQAELDGVCDRFVGWTAKPNGRLFRLNRVRHLFSPLPIPVATDRCRAAQRAIRDELGRTPDVVVVDFPHTAVLMPARVQAPSVLFTHNLEAEIFRRHAAVARGALRRALWRSQHRKMKQYENSALRRFDAVVAVSERDRQSFRDDYGVNHTYVIPTGVDIEYFQGREASEAAAGAQNAETIVFTGSLDWMPNIDGLEYFMTEVWPLIVAERPAVRFVAVGRNPPARLIDAARRRGLEWEFTGMVEDVRPFVHRSLVYVIPLRVGGGTRLKVFEAMAMGCPVVSTSIGVEGLPLEAERHFLPADTPGDFASAVLRLLSDGKLRSRMAREARRHVVENFSSRIAAESFEAICARVASPGAGGLPAP
jgi:glycosyltransferase involved in cell wall biosynthesis